MLKKTISPYILAAAVGALIIVVAPATASASFPQDGLMKALADSASTAAMAAFVFAVAVSFWLVRPFAKSLESGDGQKAAAALDEFCRRRKQVSMLAALAI